MANERRNTIDEINEDMSHVTATKAHNKNNTDEALLVNVLDYYSLGTDTMRTQSTARAQMLSSATLWRAPLDHVAFAALTIGQR